MEFEICRSVHVRTKGRCKMTKVFIDRDVLLRHRACDKWVLEFENRFPDGIEIDFSSKEDIRMAINAGFKSVLSYLDNNPPGYFNEEVRPFRIVLDGQDLRDMDFCDVDLTGASMKNADLSGVDMQGADLTNVDFEGANLTGAMLDSAKIYNAMFHGANLTGAMLDSAKIYNAMFHGANLTGASLIEASINGVNFDAANLTGANLSHSYMYEVSFGAANLDDSRFNKAVIYDSDKITMRLVREWAAEDEGDDEEE